MFFQVHRIGCVWKTPFHKSSHFKIIRVSWNSEHVTEFPLPSILSTHKHASLQLSLQVVIYKLILFIFQLHK